MNREVAMTGEVGARANSHLLQHYTEGGNQEDLRFGVLLRAPAG